MGVRDSVRAASQSAWVVNFWWWEQAEDAWQQKYNKGQDSNREVASTRNYVW